MKWFKGVENIEQLRKRYKELLKVYHPDNGGKVSDMQEINAEFDELSKVLLYREMATRSGNTNLFDRVVDLAYENEQLKSKVQTLQEMLNQAYEFMRKIVVDSRNAFDVFMEQVEGAKEWIRNKVVGVGR